MKMIYQSGIGEVVEKKSRFIANVFQVLNEEQAMSYINDIKKKYYDARHNCYAYVCGDKNEIQRFSDDGEPSGTAGKPILEVITSQDIRNCLVVVTRYFGGIMLGTGGLLRAYQTAAKEGLANSEIVAVYQGRRAVMDIDYNYIGKLQYICGELGAEIIKSEYGANVHMEILVDMDKYGQFTHKLTEAFSANVNILSAQNQNFCKTKDNKTILMKKCE